MTDWQEFAKCPNCGISDWMPILYGLPSEVALQAAERNILTLGGCVALDHMPTAHCRACDHEWGTLAGDSICPPDLIALGNTSSVAQLSKLLENAGWHSKTLSHQSDGNETVAEMAFGKPGANTRVTIRISLSEQCVPVWIVPSLEDLSDADEVYALLVSAESVTPTRTRPWWKPPSE